jgi:hypothetical protein
LLKEISLLFAGIPQALLHDLPDPNALISIEVKFLFKYHPSFYLNNQFSPIASSQFHSHTMSDFPGKMI